MSLAERLDKLEPRERTLLGALVGVFAAIVVFGVPIALWSTVSSMRDENQEMHDVIDTIVESRGKLDKKKQERDAQLARYARKAPDMATYLEDAARANDVELTETQTKADIPHGKRYIEKLTVAKVRKTGLLGLSKTLEKIARSGYPVAVTRLSIKPKLGEPDSYDVELGVSAFSRKEDAKKKADEEAPTDEESAADGENEEEEL